MSESLEEYVRRLGEGGVLKAYRMYASGELVIKDPSPPRDFLEYVLRPDYSLWFWASVMTGLLAVATVFLLPWAIPLRLVLGAIIMFFLPGYVTVELFFPRENSLNDLERLGLSVVSSFAVTSLMGLILNLTPAGINVVSSAVTTMVYVTLVGLAAAYRKCSLIRKPTA